MASVDTDAINEGKAVWRHVERDIVAQVPTLTVEFCLCLMEWHRKAREQGRLGPITISVDILFFLLRILLHGFCLWHSKRPLH